MKYSPSDFFTIWKTVFNERKAGLLKTWSSCPDYSSEIFHVENSVIRGVASKLELEVLYNYYCLDSIFFRSSDRVKVAPTRQNWVQNIRVAFEHENYFGSGLFQEVSHLLITRADLRVLVGYPNNEQELQPELNRLSGVIADSDLAETNPNFLLILGERTAEPDILWRAFTCQQKQLRPL